MSYGNSKAIASQKAQYLISSGALDGTNLVSVDHIFINPSQGTKHLILNEEWCVTADFYSLE
ncbi:MAG: hypothetical protein WBA93_15980 [Microcoleaceae cyanobacterium]